MTVDPNNAIGMATNEVTSYPHAAVRFWLYAVAALIFAMVVVGGATRLTGSGLSITEWQPIMGVIPPLSQADWQEAFQKYQKILQYKILNQAMSLSEFKEIYWWEWSHRFLGRFIGIAFLVPFLLFWLQGSLPRVLIPKLSGIFVLGGLQGVLGWYMVTSGLAGRVSVSQYRLAAHLGLAVVVMAAILWAAFDLKRGQPKPPTRAPFGVRGLAIALASLLYVQILAGAFVAGLGAGMAYNTWPLMDGAFIPNGLDMLQPWYVNLFENVLTVQFDHRMLAYAIAVMALMGALLTPAPWRMTALLVLAAVTGQVVLGILTLLTQVQIGFALAHQAGAILVFAVALYHLHNVRTRI